MDLNWIKINEGLISGVELINKIDTLKFQQLVTHIIENETERTKGGLFGAEELTKLEKVLKLNSNEIIHLTKTIRHIVKRMSKFIMIPIIIMNNLKDFLHVESEKAKILVNTYKLIINKISNDFNINNFGHLEELTEPSWQVDVELSSSLNKTEKQITVLMDLKTTGYNKEYTKRSLFELNIDELQGFQQQIEIIQNELDNLI